MQSDKTMGLHIYTSLILHAPPLWVEMWRERQVQLGNTLFRLYNSCFAAHCTIFLFFSATSFLSYVDSVFQSNVEILQKHLCKSQKNRRTYIIASQKDTVIFHHRGRGSELRIPRVSGLEDTSGGGTRHIHETLTAHRENSPLWWHRRNETMAN